MQLIFYIFQINYNIFRLFLSSALTVSRFMYRLLCILNSVHARKHRKFILVLYVTKSTIHRS